jgi:hypothetical protein
MSPTEAVVMLQRQGTTLVPDGAGVSVTPARVLTDELRAAIRDAKLAVVAILTTGILPCPQCGAPMDAFEACLTCRGRLCQRCGRWMPKVYARECDGCLARLFTAPPPSRPLPPEQMLRLHPCPRCGKLIPRLWERCAPCTATADEGAPPDGQVPPGAVWDADAAQVLVGTLIRRVAAAWDALPRERRPDPHALLRDADRALWAAYHARDLPGLQAAARDYARAAEPIFAATERRQPREAVPS